MRTHRLDVGFAAVLAAGVAAAACGGNVVVDGQGSGGSGATSGSVSGTGTGGPQTATSTGTSGTDPKSLCLPFCQTSIDNNCSSEPLDRCVQACIDLYASSPECEPVTTAYLQCLVENLIGCEIPAACLDALTSYEACTKDRLCGDVECAGGSAGDCSCKGSCAGRELGVECVSSTSELRCTCLEQGTVVGVCSQGITGACGIEGSCCESIFFGTDDRRR